jgi:hypothetical protein
MSKLTTYTVTFSNDRGSAIEDMPAASPEAALAKARAIAGDHDRATALYFEAYSDHVPIDEIAIDTPDGERVAEWASDDLLLRLAAGDLLSALEKAITALNTAHRFKIPKLDTDSYAIAAECERAVAKARPKEQESGGAG